MSACPRWFCSVSAPCGGPWANMSSITMRSGTTRGRATSCCSLGRRTSAASNPYDAASDWVGSCAITIKRQRDRRPKVQSRTLTTLLRSGDRGSSGRRFATRCPNSGASVSLRRYHFRRSDFLTIRAGVLRESRSERLRECSRIRTSLAYQGCPPHRICSVVGNGDPIKPTSPCAGSNQRPRIAATRMQELCVHLFVTANRYCTFLCSPCFGKPSRPL
jgi:hypothetical protein